MKLGVKFNTTLSRGPDNKSRSVMQFSAYVKVLRDTVILGTERNVFLFIFIKEILCKALTQRFKS